MNLKRLAFLCLVSFLVTGALSSTLKECMAFQTTLLQDKIKSLSAASDFDWDHMFADFKNYLLTSKNCDGIKWLAFGEGGVKCSLEMTSYNIAALNLPLTVTRTNAQKISGDIQALSDGVVEACEQAIPN